MKHTTAILFLLAFILLNNGCVKDVLKKKKQNPVTPPEAKYFGTWKATQIASDLNGNMQIDANELYAFTGISELKLNDTKIFSFSLITSSGASNMSGNWTMAADQKSLSIADATQGSIRFDERINAELQT
jgi:hypothetical protein